MAKYATLYNFTTRASGAVKESPSRLKAAIEGAEGVGMKMLAVYYTAGPYDIIAIWEADDEKAATAFALATAAKAT